MNSQQAHKKVLNITKHHGNVTMTIIKKTRRNKCGPECGEKGALVHCWWEYKLEQPQWEAVWSLLKKLKIEVAYNPAIPHLSI